MADFYTETKLQKAVRIIFGIIDFMVRIALILLLVIAIKYVISIGYDFGYSLFHGKAMAESPGREVTFTIEKGDSTEKIVDELIDEGLIKDDFVSGRLAFYCQKRFYDKQLMPGTYTLRTDMTSRDILFTLNGG